MYRHEFIKQICEWHEANNKQTGVHVLRTCLNEMKT